jgi:hypothetical protein
MSAEIKKEIALEIAHILFVDIVGYSKLSINEQHAVVEELNQVVRRWPHSPFQTCRRGSRGIRTVATAPARSRRMRSEAWDARVHCESSCGSSGQSAAAEKVSNPEEAKSANALGGHDGSVARARGNRRRHHNIFPLSRAINAGCAGKIDRGAAV